MMEWFKIVTRLPRDPKWRAVGARAKVLYIEWACEVAEQETDGVFHILGKHPKEAAELERVGLIESHPEGFYLPAFLKWNPPHAELERKREEARERAARTKRKVRAKPQESSLAEERREEEKKPSRRPGVDAILRACGGDPMAATADAQRTAGVKLAAIRTAESTRLGRDIPEDDPALLAALKLYARRYAKKWPSWALTPAALAQHWHELGDTTPADRDATYFQAQDPDPDELAEFAAAVEADSWRARKDLA